MAKKWLKMAKKWFTNFFYTFSHSVCSHGFILRPNRLIFLYIVAIALGFLFSFLGHGKQMAKNGQTMV